MTYEVTINVTKVVEAKNENEAVATFFEGLPSDAGTWVEENLVVTKQSELGFPVRMAN